MLNKEKEKIILKVVREIGLYLGDPIFKATIRIGVSSKLAPFREIGTMWSLREDDIHTLEASINEIKRNLEIIAISYPELLKKYGITEEIILK